METIECSAIAPKLFSAPDEFFLALRYGQFVENRVLVKVFHNGNEATELQRLETSLDFVVEYVKEHVTEAFKDKDKIQRVSELFAFCPDKTVRATIQRLSGSSMVVEMAEFLANVDLASNNALSTRLALGEL